MSSPSHPQNLDLLTRLRRLSAPPTRRHDVPYTAWEEVGPPGSVATGDNETEFENGWGNVGAPYPNAAFHVDESGKVWIRGAVDGGASGTTIFTLPEYARPEFTERFFVATDIAGTGATLDVHADGTVVWVG
jgi:hypothetical protein